ncbi:MAG: hypothetical protein JWM99_3127 [Verrucomicrobiales bacterium]|nr:hypothetical protein [Verrucomicrobiales bacterium]
MLNKSRSNTGVDDAFLHKNVLLCCGEDAAELLDAVNRNAVGLVLAEHKYRCYHFWRFSNFTLIWTGIGTGCLEPLLYEILMDSPVETICLIGTAGMCRSREGLIKGQAYCITEARTWAAGVRPVEFDTPLRPNWGAGQSLIPEATIVSTDYYYGFSRIENPQLCKLRERDEALSRDFRTLLKEIDLVDMEVAQFYFICSAFHKPGLNWLAVKGPANALDKFSEQIENSPAVLESTVWSALVLMKVVARGSRLGSEARDSAA